MVLAPQFLTRGGPHAEKVTTSSVYKESEEEILQVQILQNGWSLQYVYRVQNPTLYEQYMK